MENEREELKQSKEKPKHRKCVFNLGLSSTVEIIELFFICLEMIKTIMESSSSSTESEMSPSHQSPKAPEPTSIEKDFSELEVAFDHLLQSIRDDSQRAENRSRRRRRSSSSRQLAEQPNDNSSCSEDNEYFDYTDESDHDDCDESLDGSVVQDMERLSKITPMIREEMDKEQKLFQATNCSNLATSCYSNLHENQTQSEKNIDKSKHMDDLSNKINNFARSIHRFCQFKFGFLFLLNFFIWVLLFKLVHLRPDEAGRLRLTTFSNFAWMTYLLGIAVSAWKM